MKREKYLLNTFCFDMKKERAIYDFLCKEKINKKQKKLLTKETEFRDYDSWKQYIVTKYQVYPKKNLLEFSKFINLLLRDAKKYNSYQQSVCIAGITVVLTLFINELFKTIFLFINEGALILVLGTIFLAISFILLLLFFVTRMYNNYGFESKKINFLIDIKEIIDDLIKI